MKKTILLLILLLTSVIQAQYIETPQYGPVQIDYADSNDSALDPNSTSWAAAALWESISTFQNGLKVQFYAYDPNDPNGETFNYEFYVADYGCNAQKVVSGSATVGGAKLSHNPATMAALNSGSIDPNYAWVDTLGAVTTEWMNTGVGSSYGVLRQNYGGNNDVSALIFDRQSGKKAWCRIYNRSNAYLEVYVIAYGY